MTPNRLPDAVEGLLAKVSDAVVNAKEYLAESLRPGPRDDDSEDDVPRSAFGPDGMPLRASAPRAQAAVGYGPPPQHEAALECIHAAGVDVMQMPAEQRSVLLGGQEGRWLVGRQTHPDVFVRLVPDEALRVCISRCHFELARAPPGAGQGAALFLRKHSQNDLLVNGACVAQEAVPVTQGALIGLCTPSDRSTPFLVFRAHLQESPPPRAQSWVERQLQQQQDALQMQLPRTQGHSDQRGQAQQSVPQWKDLALAAPYRLVCLSAMGSDVAAMPPEAKTIGVHGNEPFALGRQHQLGFFEGLLGAEPRYLTIIGRSHVEIAPVPGDACAFKVTNLSANPIVMDQQRFNKGQHGFVRPPACLMFIASKTSDAGDAFAFLTLGFEPAPAAAGGHQPAPTSPAMWAGPTAAACTPVAAAALQAGACTSLPTSPLPPVTPQQQFEQQQLQMQQQQQQFEQQQQQHHFGQESSGRPTLPAPLGPPATQQPAGGQGQLLETEVAFCVELGGTAVRPGASASLRRIAGGHGGLTVGRLHQRQQLAEALCDDVAQYVSREHFRIERNAICGGFNLVALSSNLLWLSRAGQRVEARRNEPLPFAHGDVLQFYTGASDYTPDGPGCRGTLYWIFYDAASAPMQSHMVEETVAVQKQVGLGFAQGPATPRGPPQAAPHVPATACYDMRPPSLSGTPEQQAQQLQHAWPDSPGFGWQQQPSPGLQPPATHTAAAYAPRGWEDQLPTPGTPVDSRSAWGRAATPPRSPRASPRAASPRHSQPQGWGGPASADYSLTHQYGGAPAPMFGAGGGKGSGWGGGFAGASSNTYYEKAITD